MQINSFGEVFFYNRRARIRKFDRCNDNSLKAIRHDRIWSKPCWLSLILQNASISYPEEYSPIIFLLLMRGMLVYNFLDHLYFPSKVHESFWNKHIPILQVNLFWMCYRRSTVYIHPDLVYNPFIRLGDCWDGCWVTAGNCSWHQLEFCCIEPKKNGL